MKTLYIVRHAKSSWKFPDLADIERPLNKRGKRDVPNMGKHLKKQIVNPDTLISSPANRAYTTAKGIAKSLEIPTSKIEIRKELYHASVPSLINTIYSLDEEWNTVMLFGHNPGFTDLANELCATSIYNIPTCGVAICQFEIDSWRNIQKGKGILKSFIYPKGI